MTNYDGSKRIKAKFNEKLMEIIKFYMCFDDLFVVVAYFNLFQMVQSISLFLSKFVKFCLDRCADAFFQVPDAQNTPKVNQTI